MPKYIVITMLIAITLFSCKDDNEDLTTTVDKGGSIESAVHVTHLDSSHDILTTTHKVWVKNNIYKEVEYHDTLPALGIESTTAENSNGDTQPVAVRKDYEIYITVK